ncbi:MAG: hypothetical protein WCA35_26045 [Kovacikia sp.]
MYWLAINREWTSISELQSNMVPTVSRANLLESLESPIWRSLIIGDHAASGRVDGTIRLWV